MAIRHQNSAVFGILDRGRVDGRVTAEGECPAGQQHWLRIDIGQCLSPSLDNAIRAATDMSAPRPASFVLFRDHAVNSLNIEIHACEYTVIRFFAGLDSYLAGLIFDLAGERGKPTGSDICPGLFR